ncbi:hypothetical protein EVAR_46014_1 [Eumeta japonica]|uniref:Uncharacterized protein n=1 Tax=Eumeta variegata TaxID=151549 RepID=A0A4C1Z229_EUMVA|nr:hypothetical protein EVAR_46014_1 [Eumeta japonica]
MTGAESQLKSERLAKSRPGTVIEMEPRKKFQLLKYNAAKTERGSLYRTKDVARAYFFLGPAEKRPRNIQQLPNNEEDNGLLAKRGTRFLRLPRPAQRGSSAANARRRQDDDDSGKDGFYVPSEK